MSFYGHGFEDEYYGKGGMRAGWCVYSLARRHCALLGPLSARSAEGGRLSAR